MFTRPVHKKLFWGALLAALILFPAAINPVVGQITSISANRADSLAYPTKEGKDPFFIFYQVNQVLKTGDLTAVHPDGLSHNFEWSRYNPDIPGFDPPFITESDRLGSAVSGLETGGYQVRIFDTDGSGTDTTMMAWVMLDRLHAWVHKTDEGNLDPDYRDCFRLALSGFVEEDTLLYYDPVSNVLLTRPLNYGFQWTSDNQGLNIPNDTTILGPNITYSPPYTDTWYILTVTDEMGMVEVDSVFYESIQTKAKFKVTYYDKITGEYDSTLNGEFDHELLKGSTDATLTVRFINESKNGDSFEWVFLDTLGGIRETATTYTLDEMPEFTYERADKDYYPGLTSISEEGCEDSLTIEKPIHVQKVTLNIPNVFTPNDDGLHDIWVFKHQSLKRCEITVVDRSGKVVYKLKTDDIYSWEGWNGNINGGDRRAPEGQYYFVVKALGYDGLEYKDPTLWSQMKIFGGAGTNNTRDTGTPSPGGTDPETDPQGFYTGWLYLYRNY
ncbi:MAG: T9SS type B sorting domain-containing protein [Bacteroidetes bacterium]|nr:T9SS type B sorting domain-containing protein [Bacteroidota bacterium]